MRFAAADAGNGAVFSKQEHNSKDDEQIGDHIVQDISTVARHYACNTGQNISQDQIVGNMQKETVPDRVFHSDISKDQSGSHCEWDLCEVSVHQGKGK